MEEQVKTFAKYSNKKLEKFFKSMEFSVLHNIKLYLDDKYTNFGNSEFSDFQYDLLKETMLEKNPNYIPEVGASVRCSENRVTLPYYMGSLNKFKPENSREMDNWVSKNFFSEYIVENKVDGISCMLVNKNGGMKLYTRGDGYIGSDITRLKRYFNYIPNLNTEIVVRGELIMKKRTFEEKYSSDYANPRNMVAGRIGGKKIRSGIEDIDFIAYEIVDFDVQVSPQEQLNILSQLGFSTVLNTKLVMISNDNLTEILLEFKKLSEYEMDGIVVQPNMYNERNTSGNSSYAFAFKIQMDDNSVVTEVIEVEWNVSKWGVLKPRIKINPVSLGGVNISYASGFNAKYIKDNNISPGAIVTITRSGDVIPYIVEVNVQGTCPSFPNIDYYWNETEVDICMESNNQESEVKKLAYFFCTLGIKHVSECTVNKMYSHGLVNLEMILNATQEELGAIEGFGERLAERTYENIHNGVQNISLPILLGASSVFGFGFGTKKIESLFESIPNLLEIYKNIEYDELYRMILNVKGFSDKSAKKIVENMEKAGLFVESISPFISLKETEVLSDNLKEMKFIFSGFRNSELEEEINKRGGKVVSAVSNNIYALIVKNKTNTPSEKIKKAMKLGKEILTIEEFTALYIDRN